MTARSYNRDDLYECYESLNVKSGGVVYLTGNLGRLGALLQSNGNRVTAKDGIVGTHLEVLEDLLGPEGTIVFPTHSWSLVQSGAIFDLDTTPSDYTFGEVTRQIRESRRQLHPFASVTAIGALRDRIVYPGLQRHAYGYNSPFWHMSALDSLHISLGLPPGSTISAVHHCEFMALVPYRYVKSFKQNCLFDGVTREEEFFLFVTYRDGCVLERDRNRKIMGLPPIADTVRTRALGRSHAYSVPLNVFINETTRAMQNDPYIWLRRLPEHRPWEL